MDVSMNKRLTFTADNEAAIIRRLLWDKVPVTENLDTDQNDSSRMTINNALPILFILEKRSSVAD
jgi:hypothetical protein